MHGKSLNGYPFRIETNVNAKVIGPNKTLKQDVNKHNMATANLTEGVIRFLRGEFTESYISGLIPNIGSNFNIADQYIPAYMGIGCAGVSLSDDGTELQASQVSVPSYGDTSLLMETVPIANPSRAVVTKSVKSNTTLSQAASLLITTTYHFDDPAKSQNFSYTYVDGMPIKYGDILYLTDTRYPGRQVKQRISDLTVLTNGWTYIKTLEKSEVDNAYEQGILRCADTYGIMQDVFSVNFATGILTSIYEGDWYLTDGLEIAYTPVNFDFMYVNGSGDVPYIEENLKRTYWMTELGLFSGNVANDQSLMLARVCLDPTTPLEITEGDYVVITWQIGVYALSDAIFDEDYSGDGALDIGTYDYLTQEDELSDLAWGNVILDENGNELTQAAVKDTRAGYKIVSINFGDMTTSNCITITLDALNGLILGQDFAFKVSSILELNGTIKELNYDDNTLVLELPGAETTIYTNDPLKCYVNDMLLYYDNISGTVQYKGLISADGYKVLSNGLSYTITDLGNYKDNEDIHPGTYVISGTGIPPVEFVTETSSPIITAQKESPEKVESAIFDFMSLFFGLGFTRNTLGDILLVEDYAENESLEVVQNALSNVLYTLGAISELKSKGIEHISYKYEIKQNAPLFWTDTFGESKVNLVTADAESHVYLLTISISTDRESLSNQYVMTARLDSATKSETGLYTDIASADSITFVNTYNALDIAAHAARVWLKNRTSIPECAEDQTLNEALTEALQEGLKHSPQNLTYSFDVTCNVTNAMVENGTQLSYHVTFTDIYGRTTDEDFEKDFS